MERYFDQVISQEFYRSDLIFQKSYDINEIVFFRWLARSSFEFPKKHAFNYFHFKKLSINNQFLRGFKLICSIIQEKFVDSCEKYFNVLRKHMQKQIQMVYCMLSWAGESELRMWHYFDTFFISFCSKTNVQEKKNVWSFFVVLENRLFSNCTKNNFHSKMLYLKTPMQERFSI
jgi:hypothetical protein